MSLQGRFTTLALAGLAAFTAHKLFSNDPDNNHINMQMSHGNPFGRSPSYYAPMSHHPFGNPYAGGRLYVAQPSPYALSTVPMSPADAFGIYGARPSSYGFGGGFGGPAQNIEINFGSNAKLSFNNSPRRPGWG